jgi:protein phosphatase
VLIGRPNRVAGAWHALAHGDVVHFGERDESPAARVVLVAPPPATPNPGAGARGAAAGAAQAGALPVAVGLAEEAARGRPSEDRWLVEAPLQGHPDAALYAVFDGHCGAGAAERAAKALPAQLARCLAEAGPLPRAPPGAGGADLQRFDGAAAALREAFLATDAELKCEYEGCAATAVLVWREPAGEGDAASDAPDASTSGRDDAGGAAPRRLFVQAANVGDASAALAARYACWIAEGGGVAPGAASLRRTAGALRPPLRALRLTEEHKVKSAPERARLEARGIQLRDGETRLYGLALSRALGDSFLKVDAASGLIAEPHVSGVACVHAGEGAFAVLASDGLWDALSPAAAVELVARARQGTAAPAASWDEAAAALLAQARARRSKDDCTVLLLGLDAALPAAGEG